MESRRIQWEESGDRGENVHEERDGELGTISKSPERLLDPRRSEPVRQLPYA
jgi:hypothetical protein